MYFDVVGIGFGGRFYLVMVGIDEKADDNPAIMEFPDSVGNMLQIKPDIEPPLGGKLLALLRNKCATVGPYREGDADHLRGCRHLQIELCLHRLTQYRQISILNMTPVLTKMNGNSVRT